jgi:hypothetical protein
MYILLVLYCYFFCRSLCGKKSIVRAIGFLFSCTAWWLLYIPPFALSLWGVDWCAYDNLVYQLHPIL